MKFKIQYNADMNDSCHDYLPSSGAIFNTIYAIVFILGICAWGIRTQRSTTQSVQIVRNYQWTKLRESG
jgi:hypothetical protein